MTIKPLKWDSDFFKKKIGELYIDKKNHDVSNFSPFELIYVKSNYDIPFKTEGYIKTFVENKLIFAKTKLKSTYKKHKTIKSFFDLEVDVEQLYELAFESGKYSRYKLDNYFSDSEFTRLYKQWIDNSINKKFADDILVYSENEEVCGFLTYKINEKIARVGLLGVSTKKQGKGIGTKLLQTLEAKLHKQGIKKLRIPTQNINKQACDFYTKLGYSIEERIFIKHFWKL